MDIKNIAIIAHVDHGKTTLIDVLFRQAGLFEAHQKIDERVMDSGELEKERGITITAKNASFIWKDTKVNIVDTPGHADFSGEVERALFMVDGALLLVDAAEGPLPQTRFVLEKALKKNIKIIVVINKVDRPDARVTEIEEKVLELFYELAQDDSQVEFKTIYASAKEGWATTDPSQKTSDCHVLLDEIVDTIPSPRVEKEGPFKMLISNLSYSAYLGQIAIGRIESGSVKEGERVRQIKEGKSVEFNVATLESYSGLGTERFKTLDAGNIALISGMDSPEIGDTICELSVVEPLTRLKVEAPTVAVKISVNTSPFAGKEGDYLTSRKLEELLESACMNNVAIKYERSNQNEVFILKARGELQIVILLEQWRREGFEFMAGRPEIIPHEENGELFESEENFVIDIPEDKAGRVTEILSKRGGKLQMIEPLGNSGRNRMEFHIPSRSLIGIRSTLLTETQGEAIFSSSFLKHIPYKGKRLSRSNGALICDRPGKSTEYSLFNLESRGKLFIPDGVDLYEGMIFGEFNKTNDLNANPTRPKKLTNMRSVTKDDSTKLSPVKALTLDEAIEWIDEDEWVEITPKNIRLRKAVLKCNERDVVRT
jgi:GTP-binding protein